VSSDLSSPRDGGRWITILVGAVVVGLAGWLALESDGSRPHKDVDAKAVGSASASPTSTAPADAGGPSLVLPSELDAGLFLPTLTLGDAGLTLPSGAPRAVKIGVVLVTFAGAEGAPTNARSKKDALALAERLGAEARSDFHKAVSSGDSGSADDIGKIPRGVLDPRTEVAVFGLGSGEISEVLETTRGFWIVKRID
jgi:hypothetical protein